MSKREQSILIFAITVLILFMLNYFVTIPMVQSYNDNMAEVAVLDEELDKLALNIQQGEALEAAIMQADNSVATSGLDQYFYENYSVHNFYVDTAQSFDIEVTSLGLTDVSVIENAVSTEVATLISEHELIAGQMTPDEISLIPAYYNVVTQSTNLSVTGTINNILDYIDHLAKDDIYVVIPSLVLSDFVDNYGEVSMSLQFTQYFYQVAENTQTTTEEIIY